MVERSKRVSCCRSSRSWTTLHQIGIRASSHKICLSFKVLFFKKKKKKSNFQKRKKKNPFEVNENFGTNFFSLEKENDA